MKPMDAVQLLEEIAKTFPPDSQNHQALKFAAKALLHVSQGDAQKQFEVFLSTFDGGLTKEQQDRLRHLGLQP